jgi:hypothetical protein
MKIQVDWSKPVLPQLRKIEEEESIGAVQQVIYDATPEQVRKIQTETDALLERVANKIARSVWN